MVVHPRHYNVHPSGIECIDLVENMMFNTGNALKYLWRFREKGTPLQDLEKALFYVQHEVLRLDKGWPRFIAVDPRIANQAIQSVHGFERDAYTALLTGCDAQNALDAATAITSLIEQCKGSIEQFMLGRKDQNGG